MDAAVPEQLDARPVAGWRRALDLFFTVLPKGALILATLTFAGYVMGLVRDRMFAHTFGASGELDAYNAAFVLPELALDVLVAGALVAPFVPIFTGLRDRGGREARDFGRTILTWAVIVMAVDVGHPVRLRARSRSSSSPRASRATSASSTSSCSGSCA